MVIVAAFRKEFAKEKIICMQPELPKRENLDNQGVRKDASVKINVRELWLLPDFRVC